MLGMAPRFSLPCSRIRRPDRDLAPAYAGGDRQPRRADRLHRLGRRSFREALGRLFRSVGLRAEIFGSAAELLQTKLPDVPGCLILDVRLPGLSGLDIQSELAKANVLIPIIFMTGHGDIPMSVRAMKAGAIDFLTKPFRDQDMLDAVVTAIERDRRRRKHEKEVSGLRALFESLSPREREIMALVTTANHNSSAGC